jgi:hypothetical protein
VGGLKERGNKGVFDGYIFVSTNKNRTINSVEIVLRKREDGE